MGPIDRREFLRLSTVALAALSQRCTTPVKTPPAGRCAPSTFPALPTDDPSGLPHLGGAPDTPAGRVIAAFVDTVVPGQHRDPTGAPGGLDVGAPQLFFDPALPTASYVALIVVALDSEAKQIGNAGFAEVPPDVRDQVLDALLASLDQMSFAVQFALLAWLSSTGAACHLGYPGANPGYVSDPELSFRLPITTEKYPDGSPL
jgi:hypothetical protein